jgi:predicted  nucleic acid-binding Zn-ribbon protein
MPAPETPNLLAAVNAVLPAQCDRIKAQSEYAALKAEVDGLRKDYESENHLLRLALDREEGLRIELAALRAKAALADEIAVAARRAVENPENTWAENGGWKASDFLARYAALDARKESM